MRKLRYKKSHYSKFQSGFREGLYNRPKTRVRKMKARLGQWQWKGTAKKKNSTSYRKYY